MQQVKIGKILLTNGGVWNSAVTYQKLTYVVHNGDGWWSSRENKNSEPSSTNDDWVQATNVMDIVNTKQDIIPDLEEIRTGAAAGATALQSYTETDPVYMADKPSLATKKELATKQDTIIDLEAIRGNAQNASDAVTRMIEAGYVFAGIATPSTNPEIPNAKVFYIANGKGTYTNFGGLEVTENEVVVIYYDTEWHKEATGIASQGKLTELEEEIEREKQNREAFIDNMDNLGDVHAKSVDMDELPKVCGYPMFVFGSGAPTMAPDFTSQFYIDTTNHKIYMADGTANASSFRILN